MKTVSEVLIHPYGTDQGSTVLHVLIEEFSSSRWTLFAGAVHFAKLSGHYDSLIAAMRLFLEGGATLSVTFGADVFGADDAASDYSAIEMLLAEFEAYPEFKLFLYHEKGRTFHPKVYLFANEETDKALLIVGSSNWSEGGFANNVEVSVRLELDLAADDHRLVYDKLLSTIEQFWQEAT